MHEVPLPLFWKHIEVPSYINHMCAHNQQFFVNRALGRVYAIVVNTSLYINFNIILVTTEPHSHLLAVACLATQVFKGKLLANRRVWVIIGPVVQ